jgi:hypothetical protein
MLGLWIISVPFKSRLHFTVSYRLVSVYGPPLPWENAENCP